jgi:hypothetical protein
MSTLIAACGLDCSKCDAYIATQANDPAALEQIAAKWRVEYNAPAIAAENILCDGCMAGGRVIGHCAECKIRLCALERGFTTCAECQDYACQQLADFFKMVPQAKLNLDALRSA